ncbi:Hypothetical predicted protein [Octopus vulgaris]|uniref:Uncharacterized protein n=1 Tax=Octopus vulgaris TaxID=6645 RepID=A0AA36B3Y1_OCTVU|nr:Hypothetical predicted protein [Octopus vulgaris]
MEFSRILELVPMISYVSLQFVWNVESTEKQSLDAAKQADTTRSTTVPPTTEFSIESVVIPEAGLRIWHIAALAILLILIVNNSGVVVVVVVVVGGGGGGGGGGVVITCCCIDIRIPRTVQQIEKTDRKLKLNKQYIKELSRAASSSTPAPPGMSNITDVVVVIVLLLVPHY